MKQFMNSKETIVTEAIDGLVRTSGGKLARLDGYPHIRVVVRTDWDRSKVALVSGGGSGHEPAMRASWGRACSPRLSAATSSPAPRSMRCWRASSPSPASPDAC